MLECLADKAFRDGKNKQVYENEHHLYGYGYLLLKYEVKINFR